MEFVVNFLIKKNVFIDFIKQIGFVLGIDGSTTAIFIFSKFLKCFTIDEKELQTIKSTFEIICLGLIFTLTAQLAFFIASPEISSLSENFLAKFSVLFLLF